MCGRIKLDSFEVKLDTLAPITISLEPERIEEMRWGLNTDKGYIQYWVRSENLPAKHNRGLIHASGWYEKGKLIKPAYPCKSVPFGVIWDDEECFALLTREPYCTLLSSIHNRMPAIVEPKQWLMRKTSVVPMRVEVCVLS